MTERERLIEILGSFYDDEIGVNEAMYFTYKECERLSDFLYENNVFATPVTEGDSVYVLLVGLILPFDVISVSLFRKSLIFKAQHGLNLTWVFKMEDFGKTVFLTREEAEKALEEREDNA